MKRTALHLHIFRRPCRPSVDAFRALLEVAEEMRHYVTDIDAEKFGHDDALEDARTEAEA